MASALRKIADKLEGKDKEHDNPHSSNFGPHSSAAANKVDPVIDSDRDGRNDPTSRVGGYGNTQTNYSHGTSGVGHTQTPTTGPHNSNLANKLDPRVDSDQTRVGGYGTQPVTTSHSSTHPSGNNPLTSSTHSSGNNPLTGNHPHSTNTGPHNSNLANKLDPRVDSDPTSRTGGYGSTNTGYTGTNPTHNNPHSTNVEPHSSNLLNKVDPRVDAGGYGQTHNTSQLGGATHGTHGGPHTTTGSQGYTGTNVAQDDPRSTNTGPHSSNLLNKLDPRVDSDRDGRNDPTSKTGGYGQTQTGTHGVGRY